MHVNIKWGCTPSPVAMPPLSKTQPVGKFEIHSLLGASSVSLDSMRYSNQVWVCQSQLVTTWRTSMIGFHVVSFKRQISWVDSRCINQFILVDRYNTKTKKLNLINKPNPKISKSEPFQPSSSLLSSPSICPSLPIAVAISILRLHNSS